MLISEIYSLWYYISQKHVKQMVIISEITVSAVYVQTWLFTPLKRSLTKSSFFFLSSFSVTMWRKLSGPSWQACKQTPWKTRYVYCMFVSNIFYSKIYHGKKITDFLKSILYSKSILWKYSWLTCGTGYKIIDGLVSCKCHPHSSNIFRLAWSNDAYVDLLSHSMHNFPPNTQTTNYTGR